VRFQAIHPGPQLSRATVEAYADAHELNFPEALTRQLVEQNGGAPVAEVWIDVADRQEEVMSFFGIQMTEVSSELSWIAQTYHGRLPARVVAFADDPAGNLFVVETGNTDRVWFWDHELENDATGLTLVAPSFAAFMASLEFGLTE
jgi:hypothetical protein